MNGNDYLEIIEEHIEEIERDFLSIFTQQELSDFILFDRKLSDIKEKCYFDDFADEWVSQYLEVKE